jgi:hypothetical protein
MGRQCELEGCSKGAIGSTGSAVRMAEAGAASSSFQHQH